MQDKYMAYVGSYSYNGQAKGITVYDVDVKKGKFIYRCEVEVDNSSYLTVSHDGRMLYSIADEGVVAFRILENGALSRVNSANIKAMRGCHIATDAEDKFIFVSGYHDGKETVVRLKPDGSIGEVTDGVYHKGLGSVAERLLPGIPEQMRAYNMRYSKKVMLDRSQAGICSGTVMLNLPASPKLAKEGLEYVLPQIIQVMETLNL